MCARACVVCLTPTSCAFIMVSLIRLPILHSQSPTDHIHRDGNSGAYQRGQATSNKIAHALCMKGIRRQIYGRVKMQIKREGTCEKKTEREIAVSKTDCAESLLQSSKKRIDRDSYLMLLPLSLVLISPTPACLCKLLVRVRHRG